MDVELAMHRENLARTLDLMRKGPTLTVSELSELSGCSESVIGDCVQELLDCALITEDGDSHNRPRRHVRSLSPTAGSSSLLIWAHPGPAWELRPRRTADRPAQSTHRSLRRARSSTPHPGTLLKQLLLDLPINAPIRGISIGVLGAVDSVSGRTMGEPLLAGWDGYPIRDRFAQY